MSDSKNTLDKPEPVIIETGQEKSDTRVISQESVVEVATQRSTKDIILWTVAIVALIGATLVPSYLVGVWAPANNTWVKLSITVGLVLLALICLALTHQGSAFKTLLKDAGIELRRITWPTKSETTTYTWQVLVVTVIAGILIWLLDNLFNYVVGYILG